MNRFDSIIVAKVPKGVRRHTHYKYTHTHYKYIHTNIAQIFVSLFFHNGLILWFQKGNSQKMLLVKPLIYDLLHSM